MKTHKGGDSMVKIKLEKQIEKIGPKRIRKRDRTRDRIEKGDDAPIVYCVCPNCGTKMPNKADIFHVI